ncbi:MAG: BatA and WFA domain-containing protein [Clostridia bacterium]|nr:BatA and WFA domain-containing protein [Clostridia bacterium]
MTFLYPLGLLGLIGIPVLLLIYFIKRKYTEQVVSSTYLWRLSEKFLKRRLPISKITGIISLILQIATIAVISLIIAHPVFIVEGGARDYCFIIDGSGSMNMTVDEKGTTRYEVAKDEVERIISSSTDGSTYTIIAAGSQTVIVCEDESDRSVALTLLDDLQPNHAEVDYSDALGVAQTIFNKNNALDTYLVTDTNHTSLENISLINVATAGENFAISDVTLASTKTGGVIINGTVRSYSSGATVHIDVYIDGEKVQGPESSVSVNVLGSMDTEGSVFTLELSKSTIEDTLPDGVGTYTSIELRLRQNDILALDNSYTIFNVKSVNSYRTLVVNRGTEDATSRMLLNALYVTSNAEVTVCGIDEFEGMSGYDLYIFDGCTPATLPSDGTVWFINPDASVEKSGFTYKGVVEFDDGVGRPVDMTTSNNTHIRSLLAGVDGRSFNVPRYIECGHSANYVDLFTYNKNPIIFTGTNDYGNRQVVFAVDLNDIIMGSVVDMLTLFRNLLDYSFPTVLEKVNFKSGETMTLNLLSGCQIIEAITPTGATEFPEFNGAVADLVLNESGVYTVNMTVGDVVYTFNAFSESPAAERIPLPESAETIGLSGEAADVGKDGVYDNITMFFIILAVLFCADWLVYCYEKYQLR